jgi:hypothetical protein
MFEGVEGVEGFEEFEEFQVSSFKFQDPKPKSQIPNPKTLQTRNPSTERSELSEAKPETLQTRNPSNPISPNPCFVLYQ